MTAIRTCILLASLVMAAARPAQPAAPTPAPAPAALPPDHPPIVPGPAHKKASTLTITPELLAKLPAPASRPGDFVKDIKPLFDAACTQCHAKGKSKGGLSL